MSYSSLFGGVRIAIFWTVFQNIILNIVTSEKLECHKIVLFFQISFERKIFYS